MASESTTIKRSSFQLLFYMLGKSENSLASGLESYLTDKLKKKEKKGNKKRELVIRNLDEEEFALQPEKTEAGQEGPKKLQKKVLQAKRVYTATFLARLIKKYHSITESLEESNLFDHNFLLGLVCLLEAQKQKGKRIDNSDFLCRMVNALGSDLYQHWEKDQPFKPIKQVKTSSSDAGIVKIKGKIDYLIAKVKKVLSTIQKVPAIFTDPAVQDALQGLYNYCTEKEVDDLSWLQKKEHMYNIIEAFLFANSPEDYVNVFDLIKKGIQLSRKHGKHGEKSRGSERALIRFREVFLEKLLAQNFNFTASQLHGILDASQEGDISKHALTLITKVGKDADDRNDLNTQLLRRLILEIPETINNAAINKADYCYDKGSSWATVISHLLSSSSLSDEHRKSITVCAYVWNYYMEQKRATLEYKVDSTYLDQSLLLPPNSGLPSEIFNIVEKVWREDSTWGNKVTQAKLNIANLKTGQKAPSNTAQSASFYPPRNPPAPVPSKQSASSVIPPPGGWY
jgi:hypothetical protein